MVNEKRNGNRKERTQKKPFRTPDLGYYTIITDTSATERYYFEGLREQLPQNIKDRLAIKVVKTDSKELIQKGLEEIKYDPQYRIPWIIFDRDQNMNFDEIINRAEEDGVCVGWSNPCFEIWLYAYFGKMPSISDSQSCCSKFGIEYEKNTGREYSKSDKDLYARLTKYGDEEKAIKIAKQKYNHSIKNGCIKPSEMCPNTTVFKLVEEIQSKCKKILSEEK